MIFVCNHCGLIIPELNTPGDEVNKSLICPACSKVLAALLKKAREINTAFHEYFKAFP